MFLVWKFSKYSKFLLHNSVHNMLDILKICFMSIMHTFRLFSPKLYRCLRQKHTEDIQNNFSITHCRECQRHSKWVPSMFQISSRISFPYVEALWPWKISHILGRYLKEHLKYLLTVWTQNMQDWLKIVTKYLSSIFHGLFLMFSGSVEGQYTKDVRKNF